MKSDPTPESFEPAEMPERADDETSQMAVRLAGLDDQDFTRLARAAIRLRHGAASVAILAMAIWPAVTFAQIAPNSWDSLPPMPSPGIVTGPGLVAGDADTLYAVIAGSPFTNTPSPF